MYPKLVDDSLVVITPQQLKASNLIFLEHKKLKLERFELNKQLTSYELLTANYAKTDSIRLQQLEINYIVNRRICYQCRLIISLTD